MSTPGARPSSRVFPALPVALLLAACSPSPGLEAPRAPAAVATPAATPPPPSSAMPRWQASPEGGVLRLVDAGGRSLVEVECRRNPQRLTVTLPGVERIGSEDRLSIGLDDEPLALVVDMAAAGPGVTAHGPIPDDLASRLRSARTVGASYGRHAFGPYPAPGGSATAFATRCARIAAADPASLGEHPAGDGSAQAAATVVETYFALLGAGRMGDADRLWGDDGVAAGAAFRRQALRSGDVQAEVFAPGPIGAAAGSLRVSVPLRVRMGGDARREWRPGTAVVRRANDVPGSTVAQRRWHIERIDLDADPTG